MKVKYTFANGEVVEVEVDAMWEAELKELDRLEHNNNQTETRRHCTLNVLGDEGEWTLDEKADPSDVVLKQEEYDEVWGVITNTLSEAQQDVLFAVHYYGMGITEYANSRGISQAAASERLKWAMKKIKKSFENTL